MMRVGILNVQGNIYDIKIAVEKLGGKVQIIRDNAELEKIDCLIIPGGSKNTLQFLYEKSNMLSQLASFSKPMFIFGANIFFFSNYDKYPLLQVKISRFSEDYRVDTVNIHSVGDNVPVLFMSSPEIDEVGDEVEVLAKNRGKIVMLKERHLFACTFHPILTEDFRIISYFLSAAESVNNV